MDDNVSSINVKSYHSKLCEPRFSFPVTTKPCDVSDTVDMVVDHADVGVNDDDQGTSDFSNLISSISPKENWVNSFEIISSRNSKTLYPGRMPMCDMWEKHEQGHLIPPTVLFTMLTRRMISLSKRLGVWFWCSINEPGLGAIPPGLWVCRWSALAPGLFRTSGY